jgi:hypothetical protein
MRGCLTSISIGRLGQQKLWGMPITKPCYITTHIPAITMRSTAANLWKHCTAGKAISEAYKTHNGCNGALRKQEENKRGRKVKKQGQKKWPNVTCN